jgi:thiamine transport system permease protein
MGNLLQMIGNAILILPPVVLGTGLFLLLRTYVDVFALALLLVILVNALMGLPFALRLLAGPVLDGAAARDRLARSVGMPRLTRWQRVDFPLLRRPIAQATAISATLAAGDLGAIALFGSERMQTLPLLLQTRLGSHRLDEAAVTATLLVATCLVIYLLTVRIVGGQPEVSR